MHEQLAKLAKQYTYERAKSFAGSEFGDFVRKELTIVAKKHLLFLPYDLKVKGSVGQGGWASVPWLGFFDPIVTESATSGFYVVYLINPDTQEIFLSLNQGTTTVYQDYGEKTGRDVLRRRAIDITERIPEFARLFDNSPIDLGSDAALPAGYMAGHAFGRKYSADNIAPLQFFEDFQHMLSAYEQLINVGGLTPLDIMQEISGSDAVEETRNFFLSRRIERAPNVRPRVLERRGMICEGCGLDPELHYGFKGRPKNTPLEIHHANPLNQLAEGETRRYKIPEDFLVLCPNCHSMIHNQSDPSNLETLKLTVAFQYKIKE